MPDLNELLDQAHLSGGRCSISLVADEGVSSTAAIAFVAASEAQKLREQTLRRFGESERRYWQKALAERRQLSFLMGRAAAHRALHALGVPEALPEISIGAFGQPVFEGAAGVTITHTDSVGGAVAFPRGHPLGVDLESLDRKQAKALDRVMTPEEKALVSAFHETDQTSLKTLVWSAREALSKALGCGFLCSLQVLALESLERDQHGWCGEFRHFHHLGFRAWIGRERVLSLVFPKGAALRFEPVAGG